MNKQELDQASAFAKGLARQAGDIMQKYFQAYDLGVDWKHNTSPVTEADTSINDLVIRAVKTSYPEHGVIGEEESYKQDSSTVWVTDPLDGTSPFTFGMPISTFTLALVNEGEVLVSVVYDPFQERMYSAIKGQGAYMNDVLLKVSQATSVNRQFVLAFRSLTKPNHKGVNNMFDIIQQEGAKIYMFSSFSYAGALVSDGRFAAAIMTYGSPWDAAAISLIVQEAGGMATDLYGKPRSYNQWGDGLLLSNGKVHQKLLDIVDYENTKD